MSFTKYQTGATGDLTEFSSTSGTISASQTHVRAPSAWAYRINPTAGTGYGVVQGLGTNGRPASWNLASGFLTYWVYPVTFPGIITESLFIWGDTGLSKPQFGFYINASNQARCAYFDGAGAGQIPAVSTLPLNANGWNCLQLGWTNISTSSGASLEWWLNGVKITSVSGVTVWTAPATAAVATCGINFTNATQDLYYSDIIVASDAYYFDNIINLVPNATGSSSQWTNGAGTSPTNIAEVPNDGDTGYITSSTINNVTTVNITDFTTTYKRGIIRSVETIAYLRDLTNTDTVKVRDLSNGTTSDITSATLTTSYLPYAKINDTDPNTSATWLPAAIDALEIGVVDAASIAARCTALYAMVLFTEQAHPTIISKSQSIRSLTR